MVSYNCDRCGKNFFKLLKLRCHQERKYPCRQNLPVPSIIPTTAPELEQLVEVPQEPTDVQLQKSSSLSVDELANWLASPSNKLVNSQKQASQTDSEWYDS